MHKIYVEDIIRECNGKLVIGDSKKECINFCKDTRIIKENDVYIGIKGENFDGNKFYDKAFDNGASVCILDNIEDIDINKYKDKTIIKVEDSIIALGKIAAYKRSLYNIPVIAITGSVGKTSTKDMIASVLETKYNVLKTEGNNNNNIGMPLTILKLKDHNCMVLEMGMNHFNEISYLTKIAKPTIAVITNIGTAHIGNLGSRENILKAKLEILEGLHKDGVLCINNDNDLLYKEYDKLKNKYKVKTIGIDNISDYMAYNIKEDITGSIFTIKDKNTEEKVQVNVATRPFIYNSLMGYAIGKELNIESDLIKKGISNLKLTPHRLEKKVNKNGVTVIDDTYNASYDSMKSSIELLGKSNNRKIAILGDMLELGEYSEQIHRKIGEDVVNNNIDILITVGALSTYIKDEAIKKGFNKNNIYSFEKQEDTYDLLKDILKSGDLVLIKGSHGINLEKVVEEIMKF